MFKLIRGAHANGETVASIAGTGHKGSRFYLPSCKGKEQGERQAHQGAYHRVQENGREIGPLRTLGRSKSVPLKAKASKVPYLSRLAKTKVDTKVQEQRG